MPLQWQEPAIAMVANDLPIYHTYKNGDIDRQNTYWFSTDVTESEDFEFDIRTLPVPPGVDPANYSLIVAHALDNNLIPLVEDLSPPNSPVLPASLVTIDSNRSVDFSITPWFKQASVTDLVRFYKVDPLIHTEILEWMRDKDYRVAGHFASHTPGAGKLLLTLHEESVSLYLKENRQRDYGLTMCQLGRAVLVQGSVAEVKEIIISDIESFVELTDELYDEYVDSATDSVVMIDYRGLVGDHRFESLAEYEVRNKCYKHMGTAQEIGWVEEAVTSAKVTFTVNHQHIESVI